MLVERVHATIERFGMIPRGTRVLVGVSGGADSVALAHVLSELAPALGAELVLAHLNHGLRPEAEEDVRFCRELGERLGLELVVARADVAAAARRRRLSIEHQGRDARYAFFDAEARRRGCERIAVGHTLDDQAETFLLRLLRGSGTRGLSAVHPVVEGRRVRPLIERRRAEIESFLRERGVPFRDDATNRDPRFARNRLRHEAIPRLRASFNPRLDETLAATAAILRDEEDWMESQAGELFERVARREAGGVVVLGVAPLLAAHPAARRRLVRRALSEVLGGLRGVGRRHVEDVLELLGTSKSGRELHLPGATAERCFSDLVLRPASGRRERSGPHRGYNEFEYRLSIPAKIRIFEGGGTLTARFPSSALRAEAPAAAGSTVVVGLDSEGSGPGSLTVRSPRPGDRFRPLGAPGSKSLRRYLMERKVARDERRSVPVVCLPGSRSGLGDTILWVVGHGVSEAARLARGRKELALSWEVS